MTMREFLDKYVENMQETMLDGGFSLAAMGINCCCCPFQKLCEESEDTGISCENFILNLLSDGGNYKARS